MIDVENDELRIFRGQDFAIGNGMMIHQPTLDEICDYGEKEYWGLVSDFCATPTDLIITLDKLGVDFTKVTRFELFSALIIKSLTPEKTKIFFGDFDFSKCQLCFKKGSEDEKPVLYNFDTNFEITEDMYFAMADYIAKVHGITINDRVPANQQTKRMMLEDALDDRAIAMKKPWKSQLKALISTMTNCAGFKYNHEQVWDMKIGAFLDAVKRIQKISQSELLLQSGYSGFGVNLEKLDKDSYNMFLEL